MLERTSKDETVIMLVKNKKANQLLLIQEIEIIVNRLVYVFNNLGATFTLFNRELEIPQIQTGNWNRILICRYMSNKSQRTLYALFMDKT